MAPFSILQSTPERFDMLANVKNALMTTAAVLATLYVLNQVAVTRGIVQKAITGA